MQRILMAGSVVLAFCGGAAQAQDSIYVPIGKTPRSDAALQAAGRRCDQRLGAVEDGAATPPAYKRCMLRQGWRYSATTRGRAERYPDPDEPGLACEDFEIGGIVGSSCSNF